MKADILFIPGPTEVRPEILAQLSRPLIGHRSEACKELIQRVRRKLAPVFGTAEPVLFETCPATALMEAGMRNLVRERVLVLTCGAFSERWHKIALACGKEADALSVEWGLHNRPKDLERALATGKYDAVTITHNETSTGVMNPLEELAAVARKFTDVLVLVDAVTSLAGASLDFDRLGLDLAFAGTQKCLALPPGMTVYAVSGRALARAENVAGRGWLLDFPRALAGLEKGETLATPSIPHLYALDAQLDAIAAEGLSARWARHRVMGEKTRAWVAAMGWTMFSEEGYHSPTVSTIKVGEGGDVTVEELLRRARRRGFVVSNGYGKLKGTTFRIGHMGDHTVAGLEAVLTALG